MNYVRYLELPGMRDRQESDSKIIDQNDLEICSRSSTIIRRIGFDDVKFYPEPNIVRYEIHETLGWDSPVYYYIYYYLPDAQLPGNFKYESKLNDNWYFDSKPRF
jgi:hypothetical protein